MTRQHICDVPGCGKSRQRWQRVCPGCFNQLPRDIRFDLIDGHKCHDRPRHRAAVKRAGEHFAAKTVAPQHVSPTEFYAAQQRLLGERD